MRYNLNVIDEGDVFEIDQPTAADADDLAMLLGGDFTKAQTTVAGYGGAITYPLTGANGIRADLNHDQRSGSWSVVIRHVPVECSPIGAALVASLKALKNPAQVA